MDFSKEDIVLLIELCKWQPKEFNYEDLSKELGTPSTGGRFKRIKEWLKENKIIEEKFKSGTSTLLKFNRKRLENIIPEIEFIKYIHDEFIDKICGFVPLWSK